LFLSAHTEKYGKQIAIRRVKESAMPGQWNPSMKTGGAMTREELADTFRRIVECHQNGREEESIPLCARLIATGIVSGGLYNLYALAERKAGHLDKAIELARKAVELSPQDGEAHNTCGLIERDRGYDVRAISHFYQGLNVDPVSVNLLSNLAQALTVVREFDKALSFADQAIALDPVRLLPYETKAHVLWIKGDVEKARQVFDEIIARFGLTPDRWTERLNLARRAEDWDAVERLSRYEGAEGLAPERLTLRAQIMIYPLIARAAFDEALAVIAQGRLDHPDATGNWDYLQAVCLISANRFPEAEQVLAAYVALHPEDHHATYELGSLQLTLGKVKEGFVHCEARWDLPFFTSGRRTFKQKRWTGQNLRGREVLIWGEQGIGDEIRYATAFNDLRYRGARITLETAPKLIPFFQQAFPWMTVRDNGDFDARDNPDYDRFDYQCPAGSLHQHLRGSVEDFFSQQKPYFKVNAEARAQMRQRANVPEGTFLVGLSWRSSVRVAERDSQAWTPADLAPFAALPNVVFQCMQYDECRDEVAQMRALGLKIVHFEDIDQKNDLVSVATLAASCDMVISAGTAVSEIANVTGVPTVMFIGQYGILHLGVLDRAPWHPAAKVYSFEVGNVLSARDRILADFEALRVWAKKDS